MENPAKLTEFRVEAFKSFGDARLHLFPLTLLIGPNASGKSNLIEALRLMAWLARGNRLDDFSRAVKDGVLAVRGRAQDLSLDGRDSFCLECRVEYQESDYLSSLDTLRLRIRTSGPEVRLVEERLCCVVQNTPLYEITAPASPPEHDTEVAYSNGRPRRGREPRIACNDQQLILTQLRTPAAFGAEDEGAQRLVARVTSAYSETLSRVFFLDPVPRLMRGYSPRSEDPLMEDGANISSVLHRIMKAGDGKDRVLDFIRELPEQDVVNIKFIETDRGDVMLRVTESFGGRTQDRDAPILSDGTLRVLGVAAAVLSAPERSVVIIEEIDSGIHPSRAEALLRNIQDVAVARGLRVLLTSHNPAVLDALPPEAVGNVAYCYRDPEDGTSRLLHLFNRPDLMSRGAIGRLMTTRLLEKALKDTRDEDQRKRDGLEWLANLRGSDE